MTDSLPWRHILAYPIGTGEEQTIEIPSRSTLLTVAWHQPTDSPRLYVIGDPGRGMEEHKILCFRTDQALGLFSGAHFLGTLLLEDGTVECHFFDGEIVE